MSFADVYGPRALVTGASSGIGEVYARQLAERGLDLFLVARRVDRLQALAATLKAEHGISVEIMQADLSERGQVLAVGEKANALGDVGLLVNNAGISVEGSFLKKSLAEQEKLLDVNARAPMMLAHLIGNQLAERKRGGVIFVSSVSAFFPVPFVSQYAGTKAYLLQLAEGLEFEWRRKNIAVQVLCPGFTRSEMTASLEGKTKLLDPNMVVRESLNKLGKKTVVVPGRNQKLMAHWLPRLFSRRRMVNTTGAQMLRQG